LTALHLAALTALSFAACSSSPSLEQACSDYAATFRNIQTTCNGVVPPPDPGSLLSRETTSCVLSSSASGSQVDASYWEACVATASHGCGSFQCAPFPPGTRQSGEPCLVSTQCASLWCKGTIVTGAGGAVLSDAIQCGVCATRLAPMAACDVATDQCQIGYSCFNGSCRPKGQAEAPCAVWNDCDFPSVCLSNGICGRVLPDGASCGSSLDCGTDTACDTITKVCTPRRYAEPGAACDGVVDQCRAGTCNKALGICPVLVADGAPCDPANPVQTCDDYARCFQGTCRIPDPATCK
jgi:hypothetical protein